MKNLLPALALLSAFAAPAAAQEEFSEFIKLANSVGGGRSEEKETSHFVISAPSQATAVLAPHAEQVWQFLSETLGVEPKEKIKLEFYFIGMGLKELEGAFEKYDPETGTLHFQFDYDWKRDLAKGIVGAYLHRLNPEKAASIPPALFCGLKYYLGNFDGKHNAADFHTPVKGHLHVSKRAQSWAKSGKLTGGKKFADLKTIELALEQEPGTWALAGYLLNAKGKRDDLKAWLAAHAEGKDLPTLATPEAEVTKWAGGLDTRLADREEGRYLVADTMYYTIYVQKGTARVKPNAMNDRAILEDLKKRMDLIYVKYAQGFKVSDRFISRRPKLYYYKDRNAFINAGGPSSALAFYMSMAKTLVGYEDPDNKVLTTFHVLAHEGCHQFFDLAFPGFYNSDEMPSWFSEGLADCFGSCEIRGGELHIFTSTGCAADYAENVRFLAKEGRFTPLKELLTMDHRTFMVGAQIHYPQSWSFCHFLWNTGYKEVLVRLIDGFKQGKPRDEVYAASFVKDGRKVDLDALEREWLEYSKRILK